MRWPRRVKRSDFTNRRAALRLIAVGLGGLVLWQGASAAAPVAGQRPRFTGSREEASGRGNAHPVTQWLFDSRQRIDADEWTLTIHGAVDRPFTLGYSDLNSIANHGTTATLDCTGGWYTVQDWSGVRLSDLLNRVRTAKDAESVVIESATGFNRRFPIAEAERLLLATHIAESRFPAVTVSRSGWSRRPAGLQLGEVGDEDRGEQQAVVVAVAAASAVRSDLSRPRPKCGG